MKIPKEITEHKIIRKKSKFIAHVFPLESASELGPILTKIKEKYLKAEHIPYAYKVTEYEDERITSHERYSDGGEPTKTAGYPMLRLIHNNDLTNVLLVTVRIYGGVKLGTARLMKAFVDSAGLALEKNTLIEKVICEKVEVKTNIQKYQTIEILLEKNKIKFTRSFDFDIVKIVALIPLNKKALKEKIKRLSTTPTS